MFFFFFFFSTLKWKILHWFNCILQQLPTASRYHSLSHSHTLFFRRSEKSCIDSIVFLPDTQRHEGTILAVYFTVSQIELLSSLILFQVAWALEELCDLRSHKEEFQYEPHSVDLRQHETRTGIYSNVSPSSHPSLFILFHFDSLLISIVCALFPFLLLDCSSWQNSCHCRSSWSERKIHHCIWIRCHPVVSCWEGTFLPTNPPIIPPFPLFFSLTHSLFLSFFLHHFFLNSIVSWSLVMTKHFVWKLSNGYFGHQHPSVHKQNCLVSTTNFAR